MKGGGFYWQEDTRFNSVTEDSLLTYIAIVQKPCGPNANPNNHRMTLVINAQDMDGVLEKTRDWMIDTNRKDHALYRIYPVNNLLVVKA